MKRFILVFFNLMFLIIQISAQFYSKQLFRDNSPEWIPTSGPGGGAISDLAIDPNNPSFIFAVGITDGIFRTDNGGESWELVRFQEGNDMCTRIIVSDQGVLYSNYDVLSQSTDQGNTWNSLWSSYKGTAGAIDFALDPDNHDVLYVAGSDAGGGAVWKSSNGGINFTRINGNLDTPDDGIEFWHIAVIGQGKILVAGRDINLSAWHQSRLFLTEDDGVTWSEIDYGSIEDRYILSLAVNPYINDEVWLTEDPLFGAGNDQPMMFRSIDGGKNWNGVNIPEGSRDKTAIIGFDNTGRMYLGGGINKVAFTDNGGTTFQSYNSFGDYLLFDLAHIYPASENPSILYLPTNAGGILFSEDRGQTWTTINNGITATAMNLVTADPQNPGTVYAGSWKDEGFFKTSDYGRTWINLVDKEIGSFIGDEVIVDPSDPDRIWFVADAPEIYTSNDGGDSWTKRADMDTPGNFTTASVYAMDISEDNSVIYALNNGFGIFKKEIDGTDPPWQFMMLSEVDYSYTLDVDPSNKNRLFSGYSRKPFQTSAKVSLSTDGGDQWDEVLTVDGATSVTSVIVDPINSSNVYAASVGESGGALWKSTQGGIEGTWNRSNSYFNFTTIHSFTTSGNTALAGVWGGGTYQTTDGGTVWSKMDAPELTSSAALIIAPDNPELIYAADRREPWLHRSEDGGQTWSIYFNGGPEYRRLMTVAVDPTNTDRVYISAMKREGRGKTGGIFKVENGSVENITNGIERVPLTLTIDPADPSILYAVLHEMGVFKSTDAGSSWTDCSGNISGLPAAGFNNLVIDPNDSQSLYLIGGCDVRFSTFTSAGVDVDSVATVYRSEDGGQTWLNLNNGFLGATVGDIKALEFHQDNPARIYLGTIRGVFYSLDRGASWQKSNGLPYETLGGIAIENNIIYAYTNGAGVFTGTIQNDGSIQWDSSQKAIAPIAFAQVVAHPASSDTVYASAYPGGIFRSDDGGNSWAEKNFGMVSFSVLDPLRQGYYAMAVSESNPQILYLGLYQRGVYRSFNSDETWYPVNGNGWMMLDKPITSLVIDPSDPIMVYVGTEEGVFRTSDGGETWVDMNVGLTSTDIKVLKIDNTGQLYAGSRGYGLFEWKESTWQPMRPFGNWGTIWPIWDNRPMYQYTSVLIHPSDSNRMLFGSFPQGIYKSLDAGETWRESNLGWTFDGVFDLVCHPENPEIVYSGTYNGLNRSLNFGETWEIWDNGWPPEQWVYSVDFDPNNPDIMYACSKNGENEGSGTDTFKGTVMKSTNGGAEWFPITEGLSLNQSFYKIIVDRFDSNILYLASGVQGIMRSTDAGATWTDWNEGLQGERPGINNNNVSESFALSADHSILYLGTGGLGVYRRMISPILPINNLGAQIVEHQVVLTWQFEDLNNNFTHYNIYRSNNYIESIEELNPYAIVSKLQDTFFVD